MENKNCSEIVLYFHAGSENHGCEAIVRSTQALLGVRPTLFSEDPKADAKYGVDVIADVRSTAAGAYSTLEKLQIKLSGSDKLAYELKAKHEAENYARGAVALSVGGDNYCYGDTYNWHLAGLNRSLHKRGVKTVLWGCSINPDSVTEEMKKDFSRYDLIAARESISFSFLKQYNTNTILACDPAFTLAKQELPLPQEFAAGETVGVNISPLIQKNERMEGITYENYRKMLRYILDNTQYRIALIPHVVQPGNDDREPLQKLYEEVADKSRVCVIEDGTCEQLKGYISRCALFVGARTHATIAAYSSCVPTLVIGYSTKARGIAAELFGTEENIVLPVQSLKAPGQMTEAFAWLDRHGDEVRRQLERIMPEYSRSACAAAETVKKL